jgi:hypothetical protein
MRSGTLIGAYLAHNWNMKRRRRAEGARRGLPGWSCAVSVLRSEWTHGER